MKTILASIFFLFIASPVFADLDLPECSPLTTVKSVCEINVGNLHPAQFTVGYLEVKDLKKKLKNLEDHDYDRWLKDHECSVVLGPHGVWYIVDGHHRASAVMQLGRSKKVAAEVVGLFQDLTDDAFERKMRDGHFVYLYDRDEGPFPFSSLPQNLSELRDDPYRSLAAGVREDGGYKKTDIYFAEFEWAQFFRTRIKLKLIEDDFDKAVKEGKKLAKSSEASNLPGFIGGD